MKYDQLRAFEKHLEGAAPNHFSSLYLIMSKDDGERKIATDVVVQALLAGRSNRALCLAAFDGDNASAEEILSEIDTLSFLTDRKVILVENADKLKKAATEALQATFGRGHRSHYLVIAAGTINRSTNFYKKAEKEGIILDIAEAKPWEKEKRCVEWIIQKAVAQGKGLTPQAAQALVKQVGTDQLLLQQELNKLVCYVGDRREIAIQDVGAICISVNMETIWQLGEALFRRDAASALRITQAQLASGVAFLVLLRQIRNQFQTEFQICSILANGGTPHDITSEFPYMKGAILDRHIQMAQGYGMARFKHAMMAIDEADTQAKNSVADATFLAERLVIKLTTSRVTKQGAVR